ncbi:MAG: hypothetical protein KJ666_15155 [Bacteroidetes bacterium]|nr:hypothetical protein [Bacteroidota bacterium]
MRQWYDKQNEDGEYLVYTILFLDFNSVIFKPFDDFLIIGVTQNGHSESASADEES